MNKSSSCFRFPNVGKVKARKVWTLGHEVENI